VSRVREAGERKRVSSAHIDTIEQAGVLMKPIVKMIVSYDLPDATSLPADPEHCRVGIVAGIGLEGDDAQDDFRFQFCTLKYVASKVRNSRYFCDRGLVVVEGFSWEIVELTLASICDQIEGQSWDEIAKELSKIGEWEFEDYDDDSD
jgi:hypothetical protein